MSKMILRDERGFNQVYAPVGSTPLRARRRNDWFVAEARRLGARRVLELGSGTGDAAAHVAANLDAEVIAVDLSQAFIDHARNAHKAPNLSFERFDLLDDDPLRFGQFDLVFGNGILHHLVKQLGGVLTTLHRMTTPTGGTAFIEPNFINPFCAFIFGTQVGRRWARLEPDEMAFTPKELRQAFQGAGWNDVSVKTRDFLLPGLPDAVAKPLLAIEPALEYFTATSCIAQSHFVTARF
jgi:SAM-dependent methyltransferase